MSQALREAKRVEEERRKQEALEEERRRIQAQKEAEAAAAAASAAAAEAASAEAAAKVDRRDSFAGLADLDQRWDIYCWAMLSYLLVLGIWTI